MFGHGLSYTSFAYSDLKISAPSASLLKDEGTITVSFNVKNIGKIAGSEVAQLYVSDVESALTRPETELKGFSKVDLDHGEEKTVQIKLDRIAVSFYDDLRAAWRIEAVSRERKQCCDADHLRETLACSSAARQQSCL